MLSTIKSFLREQIVSSIGSGAVGIAVTIALFHFTSPPTRSAEVRGQLTEMARSRLEQQLSAPVSKVTFDSVVAESLDLSASNSYVVYGTAQTLKGAESRFLMVFEPSSQGLLDKLVGRPGFFDIGYWAVIPDVAPTDVMASRVDVEDIDRDGNKEVFVYVKSSFADSTAKGLLVLKKDKQDVWRLMGLPSLTKRLQSITSGQWPGPDGPRPATEANLWFTSQAVRRNTTTAALKAYAGWDINEMDWTAKGSTGDVTFWMIRNGTKIASFEHKLAGYKHIGVLANVNDGEAVLGPHHLMVNFFKIENDHLEPDPQWNWGYPMLSDGVEDSQSWKLSEFKDVGVSVHVVDGIAFGSTEFGLADEE